MNERISDLPGPPKLAERPAASLASWLGLGAKIAIGAATFWLIARTTNLGEAIRQLGNVHFAPFSVAVGLLLIQHIFAAQRWRLVSRANGHALPFREALIGYVEANFFNQALPSTIGGDAVRVLRAHRSGQPFGIAIVAAFVDRAIGLLVLALLAIAGAAVFWMTPGAERTGQTLAASIAFVVAGAIVGGSLSTLFPTLGNHKATRALYLLSDGVARLVRHPKLAGAALAHSLIVHLFSIAAFQQLAASLNLSLDLWGACVAMPVILLASAIPLTIGGWGVREATGTLILAHLGLTGENGLALSLLLGLALLVLGLIGGIVWLLYGLDRSAGAAAAGTGDVMSLLVESSSVEESLPGNLSPRKLEIRAHADAMAQERDNWIAANPTYYEDDRNYMRFLVPEGARVLDLGCATGDLLARLKPDVGVGIDLSEKMIEVARAKHPGLEFIAGDVEDPGLLENIKQPFDFIILSDTIGLIDDIEVALGHLHRLCHEETRLVIGYYSHLWEPLLSLAEMIGLRKKQPRANIISAIDFENMLYLADFEPIRTENRQIMPERLFGIGPLLNRYVGTLPLIRGLCLRKYIVARSKKSIKPADLPVSILVPCRNERGNIEPLVRRMPRFGAKQEIVFIEGNSADDTYAECLRVQKAFAADWDIKVVKQEGKGKGDAMRKGYASASGDVFMILDADLSVAPEAMPRFYQAIASGKGEFINGSRLIYPMQDQAMRPLNLIANRIFAWLFTYLLNQRFTDTLCGTKVFRRRAYQKIEQGRSYFGEFDPFGDFDLIFGATKQNLRIVEVPVHYHARTYGETQISRFRDGMLLLRMVAFAWRKLKAI